MAMDGATIDLDSASEQSYASDTVARNIEEALVGFNGSSMDTYRPLLATSWSANADKSVWTIHLRHNVRFHTGRCCLTADDVQYSIGRAVKAGLAGSYLYSRFLTDPFKQIKVVDPYTVRFDLGRPQPIFPAALTSEYVGLILDSRALKAHVTRATYWAMPGRRPRPGHGALHAAELDAPAADRAEPFPGLLGRLESGRTSVRSSFAPSPSPVRAASWWSAGRPT